MTDLSKGNYQQQTKHALKSAIEDVKNTAVALRNWDFVSSKEQIAFLKTFIRPLRNGTAQYDIANYLDIHGTKGIRKLTSLAKESLSENGTISGKLEKYFSPFYASSLKIMEGTQGAKFHDALEVIIAMMANSNSMVKRVFKFAMVPMVYCIGLSLMIVFMFSEQAEVFREIAKNTSDIDKLVATSDLIKYWSIPVIAVVVFCIYFVRQMLRTLVGDWRTIYFDSIIFSIYRDYVALGVLRRYALLRSVEKISAQRIFEQLRDTGSRYEQFHAEESLSMLRAGLEMEEHALDTGLLSPPNMGMLILMLKGGTQQEIVKSINEAADEIEDIFNLKLNYYSYALAGVFWILLLYLFTLVANVVIGLESGF